MILTLCSCDSQKPQTITLSGETMGTTYTVKYLSDRHTLPEKEIKKQLEAILQNVNHQMSTYQSDSEISRFNQLEKINYGFEISEDFSTVIREAIRLNHLTEGALDVTIGPLINLWGFGPNKENSSPNTAQIMHAEKSIGIDKIKIMPSKNKNKAILTKSHPKVYLDLSSIAKGFGVDKLSLHMEKLGIENYLIEIGGELRGKGHNAEHKAWRIGIEQPDPIRKNNAQIIIPLNNYALATSGDYRNFHTDKHGNRLSHIINPQTRQPINHQLASISVIDQNSMTADGLATGLFVLGEKKALEIALKHQLAVFLIIKTEDGYRTEMSPAFKKLLN